MAFLPELLRRTSRRYKIISQGGTVPVRIPTVRGPLVDDMEIRLLPASPPPPKKAFQASLPMSS